MAANPNTNGNTNPTTMAANNGLGRAGTVKLLAAGSAAWAAMRELPAGAISRHLPELAIEVNPATEADAAMAAFADGNADALAFSGTSAQVAAFKMALAERLGGDPYMVVLGVKGVAVLVNRECPVTQISTEQVARLLGISDLERIVTWNELDANAIAGTKFANANVKALGPMPDSPLAAQILRLFEKQSSELTAWRTEPVAGAMQRAMRVSAEPLTLAVTEAGWSSPNLPALKIVGAAGNPVAISVDTMVSGEYPLTEQLVIFIRADASKATKDALRAALSPAGQQHISRPALGWLPLTEPLRRTALDGLGR